MTIKEAIIKCLENSQEDLSINDIYINIINANYYTFNANKPKAAISPELTKLIQSKVLIRKKGHNDHYLYQINKGEIK